MNKFKAEAAGHVSVVVQPQVNALQPMAISTALVAANLPAADDGRRYETQIWIPAWPICDERIIGSGKWMHFFGMLFLLLNLLYQLLGLLPLGQRAARLRKTVLLVPQLAPSRKMLQSPAGTCAELSPERSWFRLLANGWPVPVPASPSASFSAPCAIRTVA